MSLRYDTAWLTHKLRHALTERPEFPLEGLVEVDESYYGGRGKPESRGRGLSNPNKSLLVMAVEKWPVGSGKGIKTASPPAPRGSPSCPRPPPVSWATSCAPR